MARQLSAGVGAAGSLAGGRGFGRRGGCMRRAAVGVVGIPGYMGALQGLLGVH